MSSWVMAQSLGEADRNPERDSHSKRRGKEGYPVTPQYRFRTRGSFQIDRHRLSYAADQAASHSGSEADKEASGPARLNPGNIAKDKSGNQAAAKPDR